MLALCPSDIDPASLNTMVAFAFGGLMGDTLFHLLPEIFVGEDSPEHVTLVVADGNKNILLGIAIMVGFVSFVILDKAIRIASGGDEGHGHSHGHAHGKIEGGDKAAASAKASGSDSGAQADGLRQRNTDKSNAKIIVPVEQQESGPSSNRGYLNIIADFTHNITDGLAMASSFYASPTVGALTTTAVFFHEVSTLFESVYIKISDSKSITGPSRSRRLCASHPIRILQTCSHWRTIPDCSRRPHRSPHGHCSPGIRRQQR